MKHYLLIALAALIFASCKKENVSFNLEKQFPTKIKVALKDSLAFEDYSNLDYGRAVATRVEKDKQVLIRIPFVGKSSKEDFVIVKTDERWNVITGRIISLKLGLTRKENEVNKFDAGGSLLIQKFDRTKLVSTSIEKGYIAAFHSQVSTLRSSPVLLDPYITLPEVVVVASYPSSGGISWSTWINLLTLFGPGPGYSSYYTLLESGGGGGGGGYNDGGYYWGGGGSSGTGGAETSPYEGVYVEPIMIVDFELTENEEAIDLQKFINCFDAIPDAGAECSIEIFTDIPVDDDPTKLFHWDNQSPGHTFIQVRKSNSSQLVSQNVGFYPKTGWKTITTPAPIPGKFADNSEHEFNASIKMNVSADNFRSILTYMLYLARFIRYDIDEYNCTDWALDVFNTIRSDKLEIPRFDIPGGMAPFGTNTPQGLYIKLRDMKNANHPEASNITIGLVKGWVGHSNGPCN